MMDERRKKTDLVQELRQLRRRIDDFERRSLLQNKTEGYLQESEQVLHSIISGSPIPAFVIGRDHQLIYWNKALEELSRIPAAEVIGTKQHWRAFYSSERPCLADLLVDEALDSIPEWYSHKYVKSKLLDEAYEAVDFFPELGEEGKWLRFTAAVIRNVHGHIIGAIETLEDVTERKRAEEALLRAREDLELRVQERTEALRTELLERQRAEEELKRTTDHLSLILESLPIVPFTCRAEGKFPITFISSAIEEVTGYPPDRFLR
jgi:PAS domain S-box-containing protein